MLLSTGQQAAAAAEGSNSQQHSNHLLQRYSAQLLAQVPFDTLQAQVSWRDLVMIVFGMDCFWHMRLLRHGSVDALPSKTNASSTSHTPQMHSLWLKLLMCLQWIVGCVGANLAAR